MTTTDALNLSSYCLRFVTIARLSHLVRRVRQHQGLALPRRAVLTTLHPHLSAQKLNMRALSNRRFALVAPDPLGFGNRLAVGVNLHRKDCVTIGTRAIVVANGHGRSRKRKTAHL